MVICDISMVNNFILPHPFWQIFYLVAMQQLFLNNNYCLYIRFAISLFYNIIHNTSDPVQESVEL